MSDWEDCGEATVVERPEFYCGLQEFRRGNDQMMFIHLTMRKWSKHALKLALSDFALLRQFVTCPLYAAGEVDDDKFGNWMKLFGFKFLTKAVCTDGKERRVFIHIKDDNKNNVHKQTNSAAVVYKRTVDCSAALPELRVQPSTERVQQSAGRSGPD